MARQKSPILTETELRLMDGLWEKGKATVSEVVAALSGAEKGPAYSTVLTMMRILRDKGFLASQRQGKADLYRPIVTREEVGRRSLGELIESFFSGSAEALVSQLLDGQSLSDEELTAIRAELDRTLSRRKSGKR